MALPELPQKDRMHFLDAVESPDGRFFMLSAEEGTSPEDPPTFYLEQFADYKAFEDLRADGRLRLDHASLESIARVLSVPWWSPLEEPAQSE